MIKSAWLNGSVKVAALTVAFAASGTSAALAGTTSGNHSILGGNQISVPIAIPVNVCGNALAVLGQAFGMCQGGAQAGSGGSGGGSSTSGTGSIGGGNQITIPVTAPVNVCGNSVAALGRALSKCKGGALTGSGGSGGGSSTSGTGSVGGGNQITIPITVPVDICGNSVAALGQASSGCNGGSGNATPPPPPPCCHHHHHHQPPPRRHHQPPTRHHRPGHHGGSGTTVTATTVSSGSLPITGANFAGLLALAGGITLAGAGSLLLRTRRGLFAFARRGGRLVS